MSKWAEIKGTGIVGQVVMSKRLEGVPILGLDLNGQGGIFYVNAKDTQPWELPRIEPVIPQPMPCLLFVDKNGVPCAFPTEEQPK